MLTLRRKSEEAAAALPALMTQAERAAQTIFHGEHAQRKTGAGEKFWQFREYTPQDRPQDIDWRQSAKTDDVFIRQKERQLPQTALFWACAADGMKFTSGHHCPRKSEAANVLTLALAILMTHAGERVAALGNAQAGRSEASLENLGNALMAAADVQSLPMNAPARGHKNAMLVLSGDFLDAPESIETAFKNLVPQAGGGLVIQVLDPAELELPWDGRAIFETPAGDVREIVQNVPSIRGAYKARIEHHIAAVEHITRACGWHYILHRTDTPYETTLLKAWMMLSAVKQGGTA